jgi:thymidine phosphorylase
MQVVGNALGIVVHIALTDGSQPVGYGIGPALEAWDVLRVLKNEPGAPDGLRDRALMLAAGVLEMGGSAPAGAGHAMARSVLQSGEAWRKFQAVCDAQGGMRVPPRARYTHVVEAPHSGTVVSVDNRRLAQAAKLAGAPKAASAGIAYHAPLGSVVDKGQALFTLHAESSGELAYALAYALAQENLISIQEL